MAIKIIKDNVDNGLALLCFLLLIGCNSPVETADSHLQKGKDFIEKGEFDKAFLELKSANQSDDKRGEVYYYLALLDEKSNNYKSMKQNLIRALELDANLLQARLKLGKLHVLFGELDKASEQAKAVLNVDPANLEAQIIEASVYVKQEKNDQANTIVQQLLKDNQSNADVLSLAAALAYKANQTAESLNLIDKGLSIDGKNIALRLFRVKINAANNAVDKVIEDYKQLVELYPENNNFKLSLASIYSMTNKLDSAESLLRDVVEKEGYKPDSEITLLEFFNARSKDRVPTEYEAMVNRHQQQAASIVELSKWMMANGFTSNAETGLKKVVASEGSSELGLTAQVLIADIAVGAKKYDSAAQIVDKVLSSNSDFVQAKLLKARLFLINSNPDEAVALLNKLVWDKSNLDEVYSLLGQAHQVKKDRKTADRYFKQALEVNPVNMVAFTNSFGAYLQTGQRDAARQIVEKALKLKPNQINFLIGEAELDILEKRWDQAQDVVHKIALFSKEKAVPIYLQANVLQGRGKYADAVALYEKILQEFPGHLNSMINLVRSYDALGQKEKALAYLEKHHERHPADEVIVGVLSDVYLTSKDYSKAKKLLAVQVEQFPKVPSAYLALAKVEALSGGNVDTVKQVYSKGLQANPGDIQLSLALAGLYEQANEKQMARKIYQELLAKDPDVDVAINNLSSLLVESDSDDDVAKGVLLAEKFKNSENPYFQDTYAWGLVRSGKIPDGMKLLEEIVIKEPKLPEFRYHLGVAHYRSGNKATAVSELKQAIALSDKQKKGFAGVDIAKKMLFEIEHSVTK
ncbi:tetratricopeptide repeat protein [Methylomonas sp. EFPC3]|uniref:tetratricopeptide repeat protein n=1 Tax=Methylomonas sp. EFPC3 TaxID=3021710 RepID=UPI00241782BD|nr:tetratricopeptide repeat protein [Methylomonas sp. EFPC3]WFP50709.1 tetratricopeptide repeat protein [Methylomonas sp. EFPC3]